MTTSLDERRRLDAALRAFRLIYNALVIQRQRDYPHGELNGTMSQEELGACVGAWLFFDRIGVEPPEWFANGQEPIVSRNYSVLGESVVHRYYPGPSDERAPLDEVEKRWALLVRDLLGVAHDGEA